MFSLKTRGFIREGEALSTTTYMSIMPDSAQYVKTLKHFFQFFLAENKNLASGSLENKTLTRISLDYYNLVNSLLSKYYLQSEHLMNLPFSHYALLSKGAIA